MHGQTSGLLWGYATDETTEAMPLALQLAHQLCRRVGVLRRQSQGLERGTLCGPVSWLRPDGRVRVTVAYRRTTSVVTTRRGAAQEGHQGDEEDGEGGGMHEGPIDRRTMALRPWRVSKIMMDVQHAPMIGTTDVQHFLMDHVIRVGIGLLGPA